MNNDEEAKSAASSSTSPMDIAPVSSNVTTASERDNANLGTSNDSMMTTQTAAPERAVEDGESGVGQGRCQAGKGDGEGKAVDAETGEEFQEAMIDEHEYTEEHSQEQRLFEGMQEVLTVSSRAFVLRKSFNPHHSCCFFGVFVKFQQRGARGRTPSRS